MHNNNQQKRNHHRNYQQTDSQNNLNPEWQQHQSIPQQGFLYSMPNPKYQEIYQHNYKMNRQRQNYYNSNNHNVHMNHNRIFPNPLSLNLPRGWGQKRSHDDLSPIPSTSSSTIISHQGETSPSPKRQLQKRNSFESPKSQVSYHNNNQHQQQKKKNFDNSPSQILQRLKEKEWAELFAKALSCLEGCEPGEEVKILLANLQKPSSSWEKVKSQIYNHLLILMSQLQVDKLVTFGSTLTGLDFCGSDLDYHVQLKHPPSNDEEVRQTICKVARMARYQGSNFQVIYTIQNARVPIIRLRHQPSSTTCDVNFTSIFGFYNSMFIGKVLSFDHRIFDLAVILKLWSKSYKIAEKMIMSNYCLIQLLIFYLQNLQEPMLKTIKESQDSSPSMILDSKCKWNFYYDDAMMNTAHENSQTLQQLLVGFFEFYDKINFTQYIVCLYNGNLILRKDFDTHPDLEKYREIIVQSDLPALKTDKPETFIVQDGFEMNLNIGIKCKKHIESFFGLIKASLEKCIEMKNQPFSILIKNLFTELNLPEAEKKSAAKARKKFTMTIHTIAGDLKMCQDILSVENKDIINSAIDQQMYFFKHSIDYTKLFLEEIYFCTVVVPEITGPVDMFKKEFKVVLYVDTINGRKKLAFKDEASVKSEIELSRKMETKKIPLELDFNLLISSKDSGKTIQFDMIDNNTQKKSALLNFCNFFAVNLAPALKWYLKRKWEEVTVNEHKS